MNTNKLKKIMIIIVAIILIIGILIILFSINNDEQEETIEPSEAEIASDRIETEEGKVITVDSFKTFYNISECAGKYVKNVQEDNVEIIYKLLNTDYIKENNVQESTVQETIQNVDNEEVLYVKEMYQQLFPDDEKTYYYINGSLRKTSSGVLYERSIFMTIIVDNESETFSIIPDKQKFPDELQTLQEENSTFEILQTDDNINIGTSEQQEIVTETTDSQEDENIIIRNGGKADGYSDEAEYDVDTINYYNEQEVSDDYEARAYFTDYITNLKYYGKNLYYDLDEEYRNERFGSMDEFEKYINNIIDDIPNLSLLSYAINEYDDYTEYMCLDKYGNYYLFDATSAMNYTIKLDDYTKKTDNYINTYKGLSEEEKVSQNINIFIQMINTKDFKHAYNILDETFRSNNFATEEIFEQYIKENFFEYNSKEETKVSKENKYYEAKSTLKDATEDTNNTKTMTVIMQLNEGTDFVMSFSIE